MGPATQVQILDKGVYISHSINIIGKGMSPTILPLEGCLMCWMHLCGGVGLLNKCSGYNTKSSYGEASVLELWGMWSTTSVPLLLVHSNPE